MRSLFRYSILLQGVFFTAAASFAQRPIVNSLQKYATGSPYEKLYIGTDKSVYVAGEIAWFSLVNVDGTTHLLTPDTKPAYVEVINSENRSVVQAKVLLQNGTGNGSFHLPVSLNSGNYKLRGYTNWMKNAGPQYLFEKQITIINSLKGNAAVVKNPEQVYTAAFFPEGGQMVQSLPGRVAFRVTDQYGKGVAFTGAIVGGNNDTVVRFSPLKFGIGNFSFTPSANVNYKAVIRTSSGRTLQYDLPSVKEKGFAMQTVANTADVSVQVRCNDAAEAGRPVYLVIHSRQKTSYASMSALTEGKTEFRISKNELQDGISHITLFNSSRQPVCERLYFKYPQHLLQLDANLAKADYSTREKLSISINAKNENGAAVVPYLSVSVAAIDSLYTPDDLNIVNYLLLASDLNGKVESPEYYFSTNNAEVDAAMDNLMMTHGWRRFNWDNVLKDQRPSFAYSPEVNGSFVVVKVNNAGTGAAAAGVPLYLSIPGIGSQMYISETNQNGEAVFNVWGHYGSGEMIVQTSPEDQNIYRIDVKSPFCQTTSGWPLAPLKLEQSQMQPLIARSVSMQVQQAYFADSVERFLASGADTSAFYGKADKVYLLDDYKRFPAIDEVLTEYVPEVSLNRPTGQPFLRVLTIPEKATRSEPLFMSGDPLVLLDGVPVSVKTILAYDALKVRKLEVVRSRYILGTEAFDGIVNFTTYDLNFENVQLNPGAIILDYEGLQLRREFYAPDHDQSRYASLPDMRNLLFWKPDVQIKGGKASVEFFTSDVQGKFIGVVEAIDAGGRPGRQVFYFNVKSDKGL